MIDIRSDTVTKPTRKMLDFMFSAPVGDDVFGDDPTVIKLEKKIAKMFGMEAALYCPSGTMTNQIAIKVHTNPGDELICDKLSHIYNYEGGGIARNSGVSTRLLTGDLGRFVANDVVSNINPDDIHFPITTLVGIENTCNKGGGGIWNFEEIIKISKVCNSNNLKLHLDGARLFNAIVETDQSTGDYGKYFDSISICLSKGLGAPIGSLLLGTTDFIKKARRVRKVFGGGMRQVGYIAAAGIYALDNNIERLKEDHKRAKTLENELKELPFVKSILPVQSNLVIFELDDKIDIPKMINDMRNIDILIAQSGPNSVRFVTHLDISDNDIEKVVKVLSNMV